MTTLPPLRFDNRFLEELPGDPEVSPRRRQVMEACWSRVQPTPVASPRLLAHSREMAEALGFSPAMVQSDAFARVFSGNQLLPGMDPFAACYGGHQFGVWAGQLGDGRAISLGEVVTPAADRWELQLKGAGPTPYSRTADGRAVLRSSVREFLCSEAMHHLGVPTTRALSLVATGEEVVRDMFYDGNPRAEPGAVVCRVAPSFLRFGNFEILAARRETELLERLVEFTISRDFPHLAEGEAGAGDTADRWAAWFREVAERTARMVVDWMRVGFVHGVMNTDNMSILGLTIDYGPYGWLEDFDPDWTPNTTDAQGRRYRFGHQPAVAQWNLLRLAQAIHPVLQATEPLQEGMEHFHAVYTRSYDAMLRAKFGVLPGGPAELRPTGAGPVAGQVAWEGTETGPGATGAAGAADDEALVSDGLALLREMEVDYTLFFRLLGEAVDGPAASVDPTAPTAPADPAALLTHFEPAFYDPAKRDASAESFVAWLARWRSRIEALPGAPEERRARMHRVNPRYVLRNYLAQEAIDLAENDDPSRIHELLEVLRRPYEDQPGKEQFAARRPEWARHRPGCSMLSCSS
jgi:serine/tyrosine/threonine adenylyltransferase